MQQMKLFDIAPEPKRKATGTPAAAAPRRDDLTLWEQWHNWKPAPGYIVRIHEHMASDTEGNELYIWGMEAEVISVQGSTVLCQGTIAWYHEEMARGMDVVRHKIGRQFALPYQVCAPIFTERPHKGYSFSRPEDTEHSNFITPDENYTYLPSVDCWMHREEGDIYHNYAGWIDGNDPEYIDGIELTEWFAALSEEELEIVKPHILYFHDQLKADIGTPKMFNAWKLLYDIQPSAEGCSLAIHYAFYGHPHIKTYQYTNQEEAERDLISATRSHRHLFEPLKNRC
jgi:hypothetical protein